MDGHSLINPPASNILLGGAGKDFISTQEDISIIFGGQGDDFILCAKTNLPETGNEGDDCSRQGTLSRINLRRTAPTPTGFADNCQR